MKCHCSSVQKEEKQCYAVDGSQQNDSSIFESCDEMIIAGYMHNEHC